MILEDPQLLRRLMKRKGLSIRSMADYLGFKSHTYVARMLTGEVRSVTPEVAALIAHRLDVPQDVLFVSKVTGDGAQIAHKEAS